MLRKTRINVPSALWRQLLVEAKLIAQTELNRHERLGCFSCYPVKKEVKNDAHARNRYSNHIKTCHF